MPKHSVTVDYCFAEKHFYADLISILGERLHPKTKMHRVSRALQIATASRSIAEDGQGSMKKLALVPLTFLPLSSNTTYLASIVASAVGFLEGYSASDLETDMNLARNPSGELIARTQLKLVPYTPPKGPELVSSTAVVGPALLSNAKRSFLSHRLSISHIVPDTAPRTFSASEALQLQRFKDSFMDSASAVDYVANDLLCTTNSVDVAKAVLCWSAQIGITIPRSTVEQLVQRLKREEASFASRVYQEFAFEVNLEMLSEGALISSQDVSHLLAAPPRRRKESKLERLRRSTSPN